MDRILLLVLFLLLTVMSVQPAGAQERSCMTVCKITNKADSLNQACLEGCAAGIKLVTDDSEFIKSILQGAKLSTFENQNSVTGTAIQSASPCGTRLGRNDLKEPKPKECPDIIANVDRTNGPVKTAIEVVGYKLGTGLSRADANDLCEVFKKKGYAVTCLQKSISEPENTGTQPSVPSNSPCGAAGVC